VASTSRSEILTTSVLWAYRAVRQTGLLRTRWFRKLYLASYFGYKRYFEDRFERLTAKYPDLFKHGHVLDIGANVGYTADVFSRAVAPPFKVFAFEPELENYRALNERFSNSPLVETLNTAVGDRDGIGELLVNADHPGDHRILTDCLRQSWNRAESRPTPILRIDSFAVERRIERAIGFVKVDVQGYELAVCRGMTEVIRQSRPPIALEYAPRAINEMGYRVSDLLDFMSTRQYVPFLIGRHGELRQTLPHWLEDGLGESDYWDVLFLDRVRCSVLGLEE
jgi:FkbM family methyltransferase